ncbi:MAG TPA: metalloregulator ArsR/SmtB family transcription factor [Actinomycetota bacterium]
MPRLKIAEIDAPAAWECCAPLAAAGLTEEEAEATAQLFRALGDPARIRLLNLLLSADREACACDLTPATGLSQSTVSHHLKKLLEAGLIQREERGTWAYYSVNEEAMSRLRHIADSGKGNRWPT